MARRAAVLALVAALGWSALLRVPLVAHADAHLDSDLAVDGLTLRDAVEGRWRWHFPGTPQVGIAALAFAWPGAKIRGPDVTALAAGGALIYGLVVASTFGLAWVGFGPRVAAWGLLQIGRGVV